MSRPLLGAPTPRAWLDTHLDARLRVHADPDLDEADRVWLTVEDLFADDHAHLKRAHARIMAEDGAPAVAAAKWVAGWYAGRLAHAAGFVYASAAVLVRPERVRFGLHPDGWTQLVDLGDPGEVEVAVVEGHPWQGQPGVVSVPDEAALAELAVSTVATVGRPLLNAARRLGRVGLNALWAEIADDFALTALYQLDLPVDPVVTSRVSAALRTASAPWRTMPDLHTVAHRGEQTYVGRKAGCCLAYRCTQVEPADADLDERTRAGRERFPPDPPRRSYCDSCSLRDLPDCQERQLFWRVQERIELGGSL